MITLAWAPGSDNFGVESYNVYASTDPHGKADAKTLLVNVPTLSFLHRDLELGQTWHYQVAAVDRLGNVGPPSSVASATTGAHKIMFEAEGGIPLLTGSAEARSQANCCGVRWSSDHQLLVLSSAAGDTPSFDVKMPTGGTFALTIDATMAGDFAPWTVAIDGLVVGAPFDAYAPAIRLEKGIDLGTSTRRQDSTRSRSPLSIDSPTRATIEWALSPSDWTWSNSCPLIRCPLIRCPLIQASPWCVAAYRCRSPRLTTRDHIRGRPKASKTVPATTSTGTPAAISNASASSSVAAWASTVSSTRTGW